MSNLKDIQQYNLITDTSIKRNQEDVAGVLQDTLNLIKNLIHIGSVAKLKRNYGSIVEAHMNNIEREFSEIISITNYLIVESQKANLNLNYENLYSILSYNKKRMQEIAEFDSKLVVQLDAAFSNPKPRSGKI